MTNEQAFESLNQLTAYYNKTLEEYQSKNWITELKKIELQAFQRALQEIKSNTAYEKYMPSIPSVVTICSKYTEKKILKNNEYCFVCMDKGHAVIEITEEKNEHKYYYQLALHCDSCQLGLSRENKIDSTTKEGIRYHTEPISKYFCIKVLAEKNKKIKEKNDMKKAEKRQDYKEACKRYFRRVGE